MILSLIEEEELKALIEIEKSKPGLNMLHAALWEERKITKPEILITEKMLMDYPRLDDADPKQKQLKKMIARALNILKPAELEVIKIKYFDRSKPSDIKVLMNNPYSNTPYYRLKKSAIKKIATALNII